ncbi:MAG: hypothetical protein Q8K78_04850 [Planctomycetaceae bacterium]|nr:hypothetical protein [Planctomycetaceae bacterium]
MLFPNNIIEDSDLCTLIFLILLLTMVGSPFVARSPELHNSGLRIAAGIGLVYAALAIAERGLGTAGDIAALVMRSLAAGGVMLGPTWIILSVFSYFFDHLRRISAASVARAEARRRERERQKQDAADQERRRRVDMEWERTRPQRERAAQAAAELARLAAERQQQEAVLAAEERLQEARRQTNEQRRREDVRYQSRLLFDRYAAALKTSINQKRFDEYLATYLSDRYSAEQVETRGAQLQAMLRDIVQPGPPARPRRSLSEIQDEFTQRRTEIAALSLDEESKAALIADLNREEDKAIRGVMQS